MLSAGEFDNQRQGQEGRGRGHGRGYGAAGGERGNAYGRYDAPSG